MTRRPPSTPPAPPDAVRNPPSADSLKLGTTVAVIAHVGLIAALAYGVAWKRQEITTISAELWSAVPQQAAPAAPPPLPAPAPEPAPAPVPPPPAVKPPPPPTPPAPKVIDPPAPPAPREADIARERADKRRREAEEAEQERKLARLEQARREKAEKAEKAERAEKAAKEKEKEREREKAELKEAEKLAALKKEAERKAADKAAAAEKAKEAAQQEKSAKAREDNLKRLQKQLGEGSDDAAPARPASPAPGGTGGTAAQSSSPSAGYAGRLRAYLKPKLVYTGRNIGSAPAVVRVRVAPDGTIVSRELIKSSGQADWDQAVLDAIDRAGVVPRDTDNRVPPVIDIPWTASER
jgi:colicin import membrane protein